MQQQQRRPRQQRTAASSSALLALLALAGVAQHAGAFVAPVGGPLRPSSTRSGSSSSSFVRPAASSSDTNANTNKPPAFLLKQQQQQQQQQQQPTEAKAAKAPQQPLAMARSALQWLPSALRSGLLVLAAFSPLVAYSAGAEAARSGGRAGGSGFRSAPAQTRRYAAPPRASYSTPPPSSSYGRSRSYSPPPPTRGYVERVPMAVPVVPYSPFGYGGFGFGLSPFSPFGGGMMVQRGYGISPLDIIILGGVAYTAYNILKNSAVGGSKWDGVDDEAGPSSLGTGVTVLKIQVGLSVPNRAAKSTILGQLDDIAKTADVGTRQGLSSLVSTTALALLRSSNDWVSGYGESRQFGTGTGDSGKAEAEYSRLAVRERSKFEKEVNMMTRRSLNDQQPYLVDARPTLAVVTICVAIRGRATKLPPSLSSAGKLKEALQTLAADAMTDDGENVLATEVLWTPQDESDVLTKRDLIEDYPELMEL